MPKPLPMVDVTAPICCRPLAAGPLDADTAVELALRLKALADPARLRLMSILMAPGAGETGTNDLAAAVDLTAATVSHHLTQLRNAGLVRSERRGVSVVHRADTDALDALRGALATCC